jgi:hypothetical protein
MTVADNLRRIGACIGTGLIVALTLYVVGLYIGPLLMPYEFVTDTGPNIYSLYLWGATTVAFVAGLIFALRISRARR